LLTFADLFCGAGGLSLGFVLAGLRPLWALDGDPVCGETYRANIGDHFVLADAKGFDFSSLPVPDVLVGGPPCFPRGTLVLAKKGMTDISDLQIGDEVLTHAGVFRKVEKVYVSRYIGPLVRLSLSHGAKEVLCTPDHPLLVRRKRVLYRDETGKKIHRIVYDPP
jgi:hypothetical protein